MVIKYTVDVVSTTTEISFIIRTYIDIFLIFYVAEPAHGIEKKRFKNGLKTGLKTGVKSTSYSVPIHVVGDKILKTMKS